MTHLQHTGQLSDDRLAQLATAHLVKSASLQLVAELLTRLREMNFPWWTPEQLRRAYPAVERMRWLQQREDVRQRITTQLTGLAPRAARNKSPDFQAELIDSVIDEGDIGLDVFEAAFEPADLAVYGPAEEYFQLFKRRMPWEDDSTPHQDLIGWLIGAFIADKSALDNSPRTPVLSALDVRTAIDGVVWHSRVPLHVRVAIDEARFASQRERPYEPFTVDRELTIATPALIAASIPLKDLLGVIDLATLALGFEDRGGREHSARATPAAIVAEGTDDGPRSGLPPEPAFASPLLEESVAQPFEQDSAQRDAAFDPVPTEPPSAAVHDVVAPDLVAPDLVAPDLVAPDLVALDLVAPDLVAPARVKPESLPPNMAEEPTGAEDSALEQATMKRHDSLSLSDGWDALAPGRVAPPPEGSASEFESTGQWQSGSEAAQADVEPDSEKH